MHRTAFRLCAAVVLAVCLTVGGTAFFLPQAADSPPGAAAVSPVPTPPPRVYPPEVVAAPTLPPEEYDPSYDFSAPVPLSEGVEAEWFSDAAFLGDSLTEGLLLYSDLRKTGGACLAYRGLTVKSAPTKAFLTGEDGKLTALDALEAESFGKIYLLFGVNELGWRNDDLYFQLYADLIDQVREIQPGADLYLQTLLPVTAGEEEKDPYRSNSRIRDYNARLAALAAEKGVYLLDVHSAFAGEDGTLADEGSTDGVHLTRGYYSIWLDYLKCHTV